ncbi:MAG: SMEK domain-containing protein [Bacteroidota bacterium]
MNRSNYFDSIEEKINILAVRIISRGRLNLLNLNLHSENFYFHFLNLLFGWDTRNANPISGNMEGIDLIDHRNKLIIQVSSTSTKEKIERCLDKKIIKDHAEYRFKFVSIARDSDPLRRMSFSNPHECKFDPNKDIIDKNSLLVIISELEIGKQQEIYKFIMSELSSPVEDLKLETTIAELINFLYDHKPTKSKTMFGRFGDIS